MSEHLKTPSLDRSNSFVIILITLLLNCFFFCGKQASAK